MELASSAGVIDAPRDFPQSIQNALGRIAGRVGCINELSFRARALLAELLRCFCAEAPSIRVRNTHLAACLDVHERTVQRFKTELESKGWITRSQIKSRKLGMQISDICLTERARRSLGLDGKAKVFQRATKNNGALNEFQDIQSLKRHSKEVLKKISAPKNPTVPDDLNFLVTEKGLTKPAVFKLMGAASKAGVRLSVIVEALGDKLRTSIEKPYSYLLKTIASSAGRDWKALLQRQRETAAKSAEKQAQISRATVEHHALECLRQAMGSNDIYAHCSGARHFQFVSDSLFVRDPRASAGVWMICTYAQKVWTQWQAGEIGRLQ